MKNPSIREHHLKGQHIVLGGAILGPFDAARIGGNIAAEGTYLSAGRIGREEKTVGGKGLFQVSVNHPWLDHGQAVLDIDLDNFVHPSQIKYKSSLLWYGQTCQTRSGTPGSDREHLLIGEFQDGRNLFCSGCPYGSLRPVLMFRGILGV